MSAQGDRTPVTQRASVDQIACGVSPSGIKVTCLLDAGHVGPHRWWDEHGSMKWVPHSEPWRKEPDAR